MKKHIKGLLLSIFIALFFGFIGSFLGGNMDTFKSLNKPILTPPDITFPIVWTILYIIMGISSYLIYISNDPNKKNALSFYLLQLVINSLWSLFFFRLEFRLFSFIWILLLILTLGITMYKFYKINKKAAFILIPYLLWLIFASFLNFSYYILN